MANSISSSHAGKEQAVGWVAPHTIHKSKNNGLKTGTLAYREANNQSLLNTSGQRKQDGKHNISQIFSHHGRNYNT
jgi:hypothetical protein